MAFLDDFNLDADISVSELRQDDVLDARLRTFHRLRLRRRNDVLAVVVQADTWRTLAAHVRNLEAQLERFEDAEALALVRERSSATFVRATPDVIDGIDEHYDALSKSE
jgi:hypothetical protein